MSRFTQQLNKIARLTPLLLSNKYTILIVISFFLVNTLWVAIFFRFPLVYDEFFHFHAIKAFSELASPIIIDQPTEYDVLGNLTFGNASIYHYLMSFPYKLISFITDNIPTQVVFLRMLNVLMAASGIYIFYKFFL